LSDRHGWLRVPTHTTLNGQYSVVRVTRIAAWACAVVTAAGIFWMGVVLILIGVVPSGDIDGNYPAPGRAAVGAFSVGLWLAAAFIARWGVRARPWAHNRRTP
jgi:hypothetical protein